MRTITLNNLNTSNIIKSCGQVYEIPLPTLFDCTSVILDCNKCEELSREFALPITSDCKVMLNYIGVGDMLGWRTGSSDYNFSVCLQKIDGTVVTEDVTEVSSEYGVFLTEDKIPYLNANICIDFSMPIFDQFRLGECFILNIKYKKVDGTIVENVMDRSCTPTIFRREKSVIRIENSNTCTGVRDASYSEAVGENLSKVDVFNNFLCLNGELTLTGIEYESQLDDAKCRVTSKKYREVYELKLGIFPEYMLKRIKSLFNGGGLVIDGISFIEHGNLIKTIDIGSDWFSTLVLKTKSKCDATIPC